MAKKEKMSFRGKMKDALKKRLQESQNRTMGGSSFFKSNLENVSFWNCDKGEHLVDIVPYIAGGNDPNTKEGEPAYVLEVWAHFSVGADEKGVFLCLAKNYNKPCPICEYRKQLLQEGADDDTIKALNPKRRCVYNVVCYDSTKEEEKGVQVWHVAHWFSEYHFQPLSRKPTRGGKQTGEPFIYYMDPEEGKTLSFSKEGDKLTTKFMAHRFVDRDYQIESDVLDAAHCLDTLIHVPTYNEVYNAFYGETPEEIEEVVETEVEQEEVVEEKPGEKPEKKAPKRKTKTKKEPEVEEEDEEEDEEEEEVEEEKEYKEEVETGTCPDFGISPDDFEECEECDLWADCVEKKAENDSKKKTTKPKMRRRK